MTFQRMIQKLNEFWEKEGCLLQQGYDLEVGAGTFNPATFLRCLGPEPYRAAYVEPSRRPTDGRYGVNPVRLQHYFQYQVMLKPSPLNMQDLCLKSFEAIGFNLKEHDIRFVHDDWESPTLGAWGLGWEVWMDGMEVLQFTYFQSCGGLELKPITGELTYGLERIASYLQKVDSVYDLQYNDTVSYGDVYFRNEIEWSHYNFEQANVDMWHRHFDDYEKEAKKLLAQHLPIPAYDFVAKASHAFNMLDARGAISVTERTGYIARIRDLAKMAAEGYLKSREALGFPLLKKAACKETITISPLADSLLKKEGKADLLLEIGSEELPASFVPIGLTQLEKGMKSVLDGLGVEFGALETFGTPRRLAVMVKEVSLQKAAETVKKKGPSIEAAFTPDGHLSAQGKGFFQANQLQEASLEALRAGMISGVIIEKIKDKEQLFVMQHKEGRSVAELLQEALPKMILSIDFPKKMRWADLDITYARPLRWVVALLGNEVIPFQVGDVIAGRISQGHRQLANHPVPLASPQDYVGELKKHFVMVDPKEREGAISEQLQRLQLELEALITHRERVIPQVLYLTEWPMLTAATFNEAFLKAPKEVLISEMIEHQKYFPVETSDGMLKNCFIITANNTPSDEIRRGNQKVLSARLKDGVFLYEQDLKIPLDTFNEKLKTVTFQKDLGSVYDKVERILQLASRLQKVLHLSTPQKVQIAAQYCKIDLASHMVYEFPELQGIMGRIYALHHHLDPESAQAIDEHWMPRGENAPLPQTPTGIVLSLAEKMDNLISCYSVGLKPSSSSDPYALRRQVLGIIKIVIQNKLTLPLNEFFKDPEIIAFIIQRIKTVFQDDGFTKDEIEASLSGGTNDIYDTYLRVEALHRFRKTRQEFAGLSEVYKRAKGQLLNQKINGFDVALLKENAEKNLSHTLQSMSHPFDNALQNRNYDKAYELIASLQAPLGSLFNEVKILDDDLILRNNRLALLKEVFGLFEKLIDFSKIQG